MKIPHICISISVILTAVLGSAVGEEGTNGSQVAPGEYLASDPEGIGMEGVWTFSLEGAGQMTAALYHSGGSIWGGAKFGELDPENGVIEGTISREKIDIVILSVARDHLTVTRMRGSTFGEAVVGSYLRINSLGTAVTGSFAGTKVSSDVGGYSPIRPEVDLTTPPGSDVSEVVVQPEAVGEGAGGYTDVHQLSAGINPRILGYAAPVTGRSRIV